MRCETPYRGKIPAEIAEIALWDARLADTFQTSAAQEEDKDKHQQSHPDMASVRLEVWQCFSTRVNRQFSAESMAGGDNMLPFLQVLSHWHDYRT